MKIRIIIVGIIVFFMQSCASYRTYVYYESPNNNEALDIHEGILSQKSERIKYKRAGKTIAIIELSEPVMVAQAEQEEEWGFFQFPTVGRTDDGVIRVSWQMIEDSYSAYGKKTDRKYTPMISQDGGKTWIPQKMTYRIKMKGYHAELSNGERIEVSTSAAKGIDAYTYFPKPIAQRGKYTYYKEESLPEDLRGVYLLHEDGLGSHCIHANIHDPGLLRYSIDGSMPIVWWGNIIELSDKSLVAGVYPTFYLSSEGKVLEGSVSFYKSTDKGANWELLSIIPFIKDGIADVRGNNSFDEPAFDILPDSSFICVMRTGATSPLYKTFSYDNGKTWTTPKPFTPNGVRPVLLVLQNGVLVLSSGRPGVQIRFSLDGGSNWTESIDMIPFMNTDGSFTRDVSCGYTSIIDAGKDSFYLVYSDFTTKNDHGDLRKSIWFRKIKVRKN